MVGNLAPVPRTERVHGVEEQEEEERERDAISLLADNEAYSCANSAIGRTSQRCFSARVSGNYGYSLGRFALSLVTPVNVPLP